MLIVQKSNPVTFYYYVWALSAKEKNRLAHALNGNTTNSTVDVAQMTRKSLENQFHVMAQHVKELSQERDTFEKEHKVETKKLQAELKKQESKAKKQAKEIKKKDTEMKKIQADFQAQLDALKSSNSPDRGGSPSTGAARLRLLGSQSHRADLIDSAVVREDREAYVSNLSSFSLWVVLQLFFRDGDRCVPRLSEDSRTVVVGWSEHECELALTYIITATAPLLNGL